MRRARPARVPPSTPVRHGRRPQPNQPAAALPDPQPVPGRAGLRPGDDEETAIGQADSRPTATQPTGLADPRSTVEPPTPHFRISLGLGSPRISGSAEGLSAEGRGQALAWVMAEGFSGRWSAPAEVARAEVSGRASLRQRVARAEGHSGRGSLGQRCSDKVAQARTRSRLGRASNRPRTDRAASIAVWGHELSDRRPPSRRSRRLHKRSPRVGPAGRQRPQRELGRG